MPLIRYEITDRLTKAKAPCPCGANFVTIKAVEGRMDDEFIYELGNKKIFVDPHIIRSALLIQTIIAEYQVYQPKNGIRVNTISLGYINSSKLIHNIEQKLIKLGLSSPVIEINEVSTLGVTLIQAS